MGSRIILKVAARVCLSVFILAFLSGHSVTAGENTEDIGRTIYHKLDDPRSEPITVTFKSVSGITGQDYACEKCHGRSGLGTIEGDYVVPAIAGELLTSEKNDRSRQGYNFERFYRAVTQGVASDGNLLDSLMPRFNLSKTQGEELFRYIQGLPLTSSKGVDSNTIYFATVFSDAVDEADEQAMLAVIQRYFADKNRQTRLEGLRPNRGRTPESQLPTLYRNWKLQVWHLSGSPKTWQRQLQEYYRKQAVFAIVSGNTPEGWNPVAKFCETSRLPCLFPSTKKPALEEGWQYTFYFNRGLDLDARLIMSRLSKNGAGEFTLLACRSEKQELSVFHAVAQQRKTDYRQQLLDCEGEVNLENEVNNDHLVLWTHSGDLMKRALALPGLKIYASSAMLPELLSVQLSESGSNLTIAHSGNLPGGLDSARRRFEIWSKIRGVEVNRPQLQAEAYFACLAANDGLVHIKRYLVKDFLLDSFDHAEGLALYVPGYPKPSIGPGQRFVSKGGYLIPVKPDGPDYTSAEWILP